MSKSIKTPKRPKGSRTHQDEYGLFYYDENDEKVYVSFHEEERKLF